MKASMRAVIYFDADGNSVSPDADCEMWGHDCLIIPMEGVEELRSIAQKFIDKVDGGRARSVDTYADMKRVLALLNPKDNEDG